MYNLAILYCNQGQYEKAEYLHVNCLGQRLVALGLSHPDTVFSMNGLAGLYCRQGQYEDAEPLFVACLEQLRIALGESHPDTLDAIGNLANLYAGLTKLSRFL